MNKLINFRVFNAVFDETEISFGTIAYIRSRVELSDVSFLSEAYTERWFAYLEI